MPHPPKPPHPPQQSDQAATIALLSIADSLRRLADHFAPATQPVVISPPARICDIGKARYDETQAEREKREALEALAASREQP